MLWMLLSLVAWECPDSARAQRSISVQINLLNQKHYVDFLLNPSTKLGGDLLLQDTDVQARSCDLLFSEAVQV